MWSKEDIREFFFEPKLGYTQTVIAYGTVLFLSTYVRDHYFLEEQQKNIFSNEKNITIKPNSNSNSDTVGYIIRDKGPSLK